MVIICIIGIIIMHEIRKRVELANICKPSSFMILEIKKLKIFQKWGISIFSCLKTLCINFVKITYSQIFELEKVCKNYKAHVVYDLKKVHKFWKYDECPKLRGCSLPKKIVHRDAMCS